MTARSSALESIQQEGREGRGYVLLILSAVYAISILDRVMLATLMQSIKLDLHLSDTQLGFLSGIAFAMFYATLGIPIARIADVWRRTSVIAISVAIFSVMTSLCGLATSFWHLMLARMGVAIGEAGTTPPSTAIISDIFAEKSRGKAMALFTVGGGSGVLLGYAVSGLFAEALGWRATFLVAMVPGVILAALVHFTIREPRRESSSTQGGGYTTTQVFSFLWHQRSLRHVIFGAALFLLFGYGINTWLPSYLQRSHSMGMGETGVALGLLFGVLGMAGTWISGVIADRVGQRDQRWYCWIVAIAGCVMLPFYVLVMLAEAEALAVGGLIIPALMSLFYVAPTYVLVQGLARPAMRATAVALMLLVGNIVGMGLGPQIIGILSDLLNPHFGDESLRYALLASTPILLWAAGHFYWASRELERDMERARATT